MAGVFRDESSLIFSPERLSRSWLWPCLALTLSSTHLPMLSAGARAGRRLPCDDRPGGTPAETSSCCRRVKACCEPRCACLIAPFPLIMIMSQPRQGWRWMQWGCCPSGTRVCGVVVAAGATRGFPGGADSPGWVTHPPLGHDLGWGELIFFGVVAAAELSVSGRERGRD